MNPLADAEIIVVGGGAVGCGVAHSLARAGRRDILLIERSEDVGQVTSSQGAGFCGQVRSSVERVQLAMESVSTFRDLQRDPDVTPDWHEVGSLRIAYNMRRADELRELLEISRQAGLEVSLIQVPEANRLWPELDLTSATGILWCPSDGYMTPTRVVKAYEHQCRKMGVRFATSTRLEEIERRDGRIEAIQTNRGRIRCRYLINAAGAHAYHVAKLAGLELPIIPVRHEYYVTVPLPGMRPDLPCLRIPEMALYIRATGENLLVGGWEPAALHADPRSYSIHESAPEIRPDTAVLDSFEQRFSKVFPKARGAERSRIAKGWPTFTPDGAFIIGESSLAPGFVMAGGCNAHGISGSAGIGRLLVESLLETKPSNYVRSLSPDRFTGSSWTWEEATRSARRIYESYYGTDLC